jgi:hypothetical protein
MQQNANIIRLLEHLADENKVKNLVDSLETFNHDIDNCDNIFVSPFTNNKAQNLQQKEKAFQTMIAKKFYEKHRFTLTRKAITPNTANNDKRSKIRS